MVTCRQRVSPCPSVQRVGQSNLSEDQHQNHDAKVERVHSIILVVYCFSSLYQIQSLPGSRPCIRFFFIVAVKSHCWLWPSMKRTGAISLSGSCLTVLPAYIFPGFEAPCHEVMLSPCHG